MPGQARKSLNPLDGVAPKRIEEAEEIPEDEEIEEIEEDEVLEVEEEPIKSQGLIERIFKD